MYSSFSVCWIFRIRLVSNLFFQSDVYDPPRYFLILGLIFLIVMGWQLLSLEPWHIWCGQGVWVCHLSPLFHVITKSFCVYFCSLWCETIVKSLWNNISYYAKAADDDPGSGYVYIYKAMGEWTQLVSMLMLINQCLIFSIFEILGGEGRDETYERKRWFDESSGIKSWAAHRISANSSRE